MQSGARTVNHRLNEPRGRRILVTVAASALAFSAGADTLFVAGAVPVSSGDAAAVNELEALGQLVTVVKDSASTHGIANGKDLVVISDSVAPGKVDNKFTLVAIPCLFSSPSLRRPGMTGPVSGTDFGRTGELRRSCG